MKKLHPILLCCAAALSARAADTPLRFEAEAARLNPDTVEIVNKDPLSGKKGVQLKSSASDRVRLKEPIGDLVFTIKAPEPGVYSLILGSSTNDVGAELMRKATRKQQSLFVRMRVDDQLPGHRVAFVPWSKPEYHRSTLGRYELTGKEQQISMNLPRGLQLDYLELRPYTPPAIPQAAREYQPKVLPPKTRPRIFMTQESLPRIRENLTVGENRPLWERVSKTARTPFKFEYEPSEEVGSRYDLEAAVRAKAFYYQMTGDRKIGREACDLILAYLPRAEFGNILDVTRPIGRAVYAGAMTYDYCYDLLTPEERAIIRKHMLRLATAMECGWPPFGQTIIRGHGSEMQINRDLCSMGIAIYDEDPEPYRLCAYRIWEELIPMRAIEYASPRHNQGINYSYYRHLCEMHAVWLTYRLAGKEQFNPDIKGIGKYFLYMRLPNGEMLRDGDEFPNPGEYRQIPLLFMLISNYAKDPVLKGEFLLRQKGMHRTLEEFGLLINDPTLPVEETSASLPQTIDFGKITGGMVARTGWTMGDKSDDVIVEVKGGGYNFGDHQHADAGAFQIFYRGFLAGDLGIYRFYGTPYDMSFNKRSIAHSMMRIIDPAEPLYRDFVNDGGTRYFQRPPETLQDAMENPRYRNGTVRYCDFGPDAHKPDYSVWSGDLTSAYSDKVQSYQRTFCFLNLKRPDYPAVVIIADDMTGKNPDFQKIWQVNTLQRPLVDGNDLILHNQFGGRTGRAYFRMLLPAPQNRNMKILEGDAVRTVSGQTLPLPAGADSLPEANGYRVEITPRTAQAQDRFLTVLQLADGDRKPLPLNWQELPAGYLLCVADRAVLLGKSKEFIQTPVELTLPAGAERQLLLCDLAAGKWKISGGDLGERTFDVQAGKHTAFLQAGPGKYILTPIR